MVHLAPFNRLPPSAFGNFPRCAGEGFFVMRCRLGNAPLSSWCLPSRNVPVASPFGSSVRCNIGSHVDVPAAQGKDSSTYFNRISLHFVISATRSPTVGRSPADVS